MYCLFSFVVLYKAKIRLCVANQIAHRWTILQSRKDSTLLFKKKKKKVKKILRVCFCEEKSSE